VPGWHQQELCFGPRECESNPLAVCLDTCVTLSLFALVGPNATVDEGLHAAAKRQEDVPDDPAALPVSAGQCPDDEVPGGCSRRGLQSLCTVR
jgi:hypothetical protein